MYADGHAFLQLNNMLCNHLCMYVYPVVSAFGYTSALFQNMGEPHMRPLPPVWLY